MKKTEIATIIGYARVARADADLDAQIEQLRAAGATQVYAEVASGLFHERPHLNAALAALGQGDDLLVTSLDRLGRDHDKVIALVAELEARGVSVVAGSS